MGDKKSIPDWQQQPENKSEAQSHAQAQAGNQSTDTTTAGSKEADRSELLAQARTFLSHEDIRDATTESKISFLEEKGLTNTEIHELLGISRNEIAASDVSLETAQPTEDPSSSTTSANIADGTPSSRPIITYPEFLLHASKPPPLITPTRVLNALYASSVVGATLYGASKFVLQPMFDSLSEARHELFETTKEQLEPLNEKLEGAVSRIPPAAQASNIGHERRIAAHTDDLDDNSSIASDPTEMFHRDIGVQTSPPDSPGLSPVESGAPSATATSEKLSTLRGHLNVLLVSSSTQLDATEKAKAELKQTSLYLDQLRYGSGGTGYGALSGDDGWRNQVFGSKVAEANKRTDAVDDFKADIRAMKGTLLSARNFPRGGERLVR